MNEYPEVRKLRRTHRGRIAGGVCSGLGEYFGVDPNIIRIALGISCFFGGLGVAVYAAGWLLLPDEGKDTSIVQDLISKQQANKSWPQDWNRPHEPAAPFQEPRDAAQAPTGEQRPQS
ncbi:hypothetical protein Misp01_49960 [Microtetraspora sp. NBRC 13810]|uniref:PspC domain-containing protein n=1 Tax=Microtetraspora sp. NBRC 13810 TaxID=3030990 RepID=UPI0024A43AE3|nr:PspC domain-containing protein [Microtetraspora sp. NBRC 13810]GLW09867.1 hypothetical protein Misp01_49960 [Microtetraspora sp. NBRC 13810]